LNMLVSAPHLMNNPNSDGLLLPPSPVGSFEYFLNGLVVVNPHSPHPILERIRSLRSNGGGYLFSTRKLNLNTYTDDG
jgi:hypothetical protein